MFTPTGCIAADRLPSSTVPADYSPAGTATASAMRCSAAGRWTALIIVLRRLHRQARRGLRRTGRNSAQAPEVDAVANVSIASCSRSRLAKNTWIMSSRSVRSGYLPG